MTTDLSKLLKLWNIFYAMTSARV